MDILKITRAKCYNEALNGDHFLTMRPVLMHALSNIIIYYSKKKLPAKLFNYYLTKRAKNGLLSDSFSCHLTLPRHVNLI